MSAESASGPRVGKGDALGPWWEVFWKAHVPGKTDAGEESDEPPAGIMLAVAKAKAGGLWIGVMVVVPALAYGEQADAREVVTLHGMAFEMRIAVAEVVSEVPDEPVTG